MEAMGMRRERCDKGEMSLMSGGRSSWSICQFSIVGSVQIAVAG